MHQYGLKTIMSKLIKKRKPVGKGKQQQKNDILKEAIGDLIKLSSMLIMLSLREQQTADYDKCEATVLWIGLSTQQQSLECGGRLKMIIKLNTAEAFQFIVSNSHLMNIPPSHFRIVIDKEVDYEACYNFFEWIKEKNWSCPVCIICKDAFDYVDLLSRVNFPLLLATVPPVYQYFVSSMVYRPKVRAMSFSTTFSNTNTTSPTQQHQQTTDDAADNNEDDDDTDEDSTQHKQVYRDHDINGTFITSTTSNSKPASSVGRSSADRVSNSSGSRSNSDNNDNDIGAPSINRSSNRSILRNMGTTPSPHRQNVSPTNKTNQDVDTPSRVRPSSTSPSPTQKLGRSSAGDGLNNDPALNRISPQMTFLSLTAPLSITTGRVMSAHVHLRDALDNPVQTTTTSSHSGYGPVSSHPIQIYLEGPQPVPGPHPAYIYVVGPGILGVSFFPTHNGAYYLHAEIESTAIKNSPCVFNSSSTSGGQAATVTNNDSKQKKRKQRAPSSKQNTDSQDDLLDLFNHEKKQRSSTTSPSTSSENVQHHQAKQYDNDIDNGNGNDNDGGNDNDNDKQMEIPDKDVEEHQHHEQQHHGHHSHHHHHHTEEEQTFEGDNNSNNDNNNNDNMETSTVSPTPATLIVESNSYEQTPATLPADEYTSAVANSNSDGQEHNDGHHYHHHHHHHHDELIHDDQHQQHQQHHHHHHHHHIEQGDEHHHVHQQDDQHQQQQHHSHEHMEQHNDEHHTHIEATPDELMPTLPIDDSEVHYEVDPTLPSEYSEHHQHLDEQQQHEHENVDQEQHHHHESEEATQIIPSDDQQVQDSLEEQSATPPTLLVDGSM
ncbi:hypothetical protein SAMD00019534_120960 [Acytostelium subglobosum LB1]|uniref:hypothetical protein n=1 Tax=Acytostelium subglobosum LB1 TaxID=1410327 RepID=UPI000644B905|nr:hypothetical protein SAMD00019534_120960 [Acytostelium subglobosum LB1]GAM28920.1 hypothetical protein SAMD00019534_120960 [Acytostelium subglobosum LB1]|eukprot:XP_012748105.1 hypothetical protein SAMD00019534_120960 [Acytostelium subglobosum LB1]